MAKNKAVLSVPEKASEDYEFHRIQLLFHLSLEDRLLISELLKESYREGFLNGMSLKKETID